MHGFNFEDLFPFGFRPIFRGELLVSLRVSHTGIGSIIRCMIHLIIMNFVDFDGKLVGKR